MRGGNWTSCHHLRRHAGSLDAARRMASQSRKNSKPQALDINMFMAFADDMTCINHLNWNGHQFAASFLVAKMSHLWCWIFAVSERCAFTCSLRMALAAACSGGWAAVGHWQWASHPLQINQIPFGNQSVTCVLEDQSNIWLCFIYALFYYIYYITYGPHKAVAEVSNHNEPIGRKSGIQLVRKSMDFTFNCFVLNWLTD